MTSTFFILEPPSANCLAGQIKPTLIGVTQESEITMERRNSTRD